MSVKSVTCGKEEPSVHCVGPVRVCPGPFKSHEEVFAAMATVVEKPGYRFLQAYKQDFYDIDRAYLEANWTPQGRYLWIIKPNGTELVRLGVHDKLKEHARAAVSGAMREHSDGADIFLVSPKGLTRIDAALAVFETIKMDYQINGNCVSHTVAGRLATFEVNRVQDQSRLGGTVHFCSIDGDLPMNREYRIALRHIALCEMVKAWSSFFVRLDDVTLDGATMEIPVT